MRPFRLAFAIVFSTAFIIGALVTVGGARLARAQSEDLAARQRQVDQLYRAGKYTEAAQVAERYVAAARARHGKDHTNYATAIAWLAYVYRAHGRYAEAEPLYRRAVSVFEKTLGPKHPSVAAALNNLADLYRAQGRYAEAEPLYQRTVSIFEKALGPDHAEVGTSLANLAALYQAQRRYVEAEPLSRRSLAIREKALGPDHPSVATSLNSLASLHQAQGRYAEAEPPFRRTVSIFEKALGPDHPDVATSLNNLAVLYLDQGRYAEAEPLFRRSLAIREKALGPEHPNVGQALNNLAALYQAQGRYAEAEPLFRRSLGVREKALGPEHPDVGQALNNLAVLHHRDQGRYAEAEPLFRRSLAIREKALGLEHPDVATALNNLASLHQAQGRYAEAEPPFRRSLAIREKALGPEHPIVGQALNNLGGLYRDEGRYAEAEPLFRRSLAIREKALGPEHPDVGQSFSNLAGLYSVQRDWARAADFWRRSTAVIVRRAQRGTQDIGQALTGKRKSEAELGSWQFWSLVKVVHQLASEGRGDASSLLREMFQTAQWAQSSEAAASLAQMAARQAKGGGTLAHLVRERQDLVGEWQTRDELLIAAVSQPPDKRNATAEQEQRTRLAAVDIRIAEIDKALAKDFPDYAALASPEPLSIADVQAQLGTNEALVLFLDTPVWKPTPEETFVWVVTKTDARWVRSELGTKALTDRVAALRCGLDALAWEEGASRCAGLLNTVSNFNVGRRPLPFDLARAHELYQSLFGQIKDLIKDKHLLIVPSGPLTAIPFQALITDKPSVAIPADAAGYANADWFAKRHAITVLPSVASLKALRQLAKASKATQPFIGFGNPLLTGPSGTDKRAWAQQSCPKASPEPIRVASRSVSGTISRFFRGNLADVDLVRRQYPLPETADELCAVARSAGSPEASVHLGENASETAIKALSASGVLGNARIVHFATHGLLASESGIVGASKAEPALILTPPTQPTEADDGLLTASEVTQLKLDADWVVLSACNTAAGGGDLGSEALSGLARAFFYAGARALLVSHWAVDSQATVSLVTKAFDALKAEPNIGRAEALRRSMLALISSGGRNAHPANWAPFVVVGEGAR